MTQINMWTQYSIKSYFSFLEYYFCIFNSDVLLKYYSGLLLFALSLTLNFINLKVAINSLLVTTKFHCGDYTSVQYISQQWGIFSAVLALAPFAVDHLRVSWVSCLLSNFLKFLHLSELKSYLGLFQDYLQFLLEVSLSLATRGNHVYTVFVYTVNVYTSSSISLLSSLSGSLSYARTICHSPSKNLYWLARSFSFFFSNKTYLWIWNDWSNFTLARDN